MLKHRIISEFKHRERDIVIGHVGPDVIAEVNGVELGAFYMDVADAHAAVNRHIDAQEKAKEKAKEKNNGL